MMVSDFIGWGILAIVIIYLIVIYTNLVSLKRNISKAWTNIDVLLKQRHDERPKLIETCKQYVQFEQKTLEKVIVARQSVSRAQQQGDISALGQAEGALQLGLGGLFAVTEAYRDHKADETFQHFQARINGLENTIADHREFYNESVNMNNVRIEQLPDLIIAHFLNFKAYRLLEFAKHELTDVNIKQLFE